jgi:hypothetical protein
MERRISFQDIDDKKIHNWLSRQFADDGFRDYFRKRDLTLLKTMGVGVNREQYLILVGQRAENLYLLGKVDEANKHVLKRKAEQEKAAEANKINKTD